MNLVVLSIFFVASLLLTLRKGPGAAFTYVFLPAWLLLSQIRPIPISPLPDFDTPSMICYGVLLAIGLTGRLPPFKFHPIDGVVVLLTASLLVTSYSTGNAWTIVAAFGVELFTWLMPYYMARVAFRDAAMRRHAAYIVACCAMLIAFFALIEFRLNPLIYSRILEPYGLNVAANKMALGRAGYWRAMSSFAHPIDLGNGAILTGGLLAVFTLTGGLRLWPIKLSNLFLIGGFCSAAVMLAASVSYSSLFGAAAGVSVFIALRYVRLSSYGLPVLIIALACGLIFMTYRLQTVDTTLKPVFSGQSTIGDSYWVRGLIVQRAMPFVLSAGFFGHGGQSLSRAELGLESVDNSYLLFIMRRGWVFIALWFTLAMSIAYTGLKALAGTSGKMRSPAAAAIATLIGVLVAMYTVWFGFVYAVLWTMMLGMYVTMTQMMREAKERMYAPQPTAYPIGRPRPMRAMPADVPQAVPNPMQVARALVPSPRTRGEG
jgi:hypothetical protein